MRPKHHLFKLLWNEFKKQTNEILYPPAGKMPGAHGVRVKSAVDAVSAVSALCSKSLTLFTHFELANQLR
jgi:hypothetical protein